MTTHTQKAKPLLLTALLCGTVQADIFSFHPLQPEGADLAKQINYQVTDANVSSLTILNSTFDGAPTFNIVAIYLCDPQGILGTLAPVVSPPRWPNAFGQGAFSQAADSAIQSVIAPNYSFPLVDGNGIGPGQFFSLVRPSTTLADQFAHEDIKIGVTIIDSIGQKLDYVSAQVHDSQAWLLWIVPVGLMIWRRK